jgi:uncharacterized protein
MKTDQYDIWIKNRQSIKTDFDITDAVMNRIAQDSQKESIGDKVINRLLMNLHQAKASVRTCVLVSGALAGALRMLFVVYYTLFT